jgi:hypothetical protein
VVEHLLSKCEALSSNSMLKKKVFFFIIYFIIHHTGRFIDNST